MTNAPAGEGTGHDAWWRTVLYCAIAAASFGLAYPPIGWWPVIVLSPAALGIAALGARSSGRVFVAAWLTHFPVWLWLHQWMMDVTLVGYPCLAAVLALYPGLFAWLFRRVSSMPRAGRVPATVLLPVVWVGLEYFRGSVFMRGYPWFLVGHPMVEWPAFAQSADLFGAYFTSFLVALAGGVAVDFFRRRSVRTGLLAGVAVAVVFGANVAYGVYRLNETDALRPGPTILAVQTNLPQDNKIGWPVESQIEDVPSFIELTERALDAAASEVDLVVWPETMAPGFGFESETMRFEREAGFGPRQGWWLGVITGLVDRIDTPLLIGSPAKIGLNIIEVDGQPRWDWDAAYNSVYLLKPGDGPPYERYDKLFLTPFGETMPYISSWPWLEEKLLALGASGMTFDLDAGAEAVRFEIDADGATVTAATPICFEDTVASVCRRLVWEDGRKASDVLINLSNDGWFGAFDGGRLQHAQIARFRCIENRVPMVRVVNTGQTATISSTGIIISVANGSRQESLRRPGWLAAQPRLDERVTLFAGIGDVFPGVCLFLLVGVVVAGWVAAKTSNKESQ